jgi:hypothetical protein
MYYINNIYFISYIYYIYFYYYVYFIYYFWFIKICNKIVINKALPYCRPRECSCVIIPSFWTKDKFSFCSILYLWLIVYAKVLLHLLTSDWICLYSFLLLKSFCLPFCILFIIINTKRTGLTILLNYNWTYYN